MCLLVPWMTKKVVGLKMGVLHLDERVRAHVVAITGNPVTKVPMMGVGGPGILKFQGPQGEVVLKYTNAPEAVFYKNCAPIVRGKGLGIPDVYAQGDVEGKPWVLMEVIPTIIGPPYIPWLSNQIEYLARLHSLGQESPDMLGTLPTRLVAWTPQDVDDAVSLWEGDDAAALVDFLHMPWPPLTGKPVLISGDPNPTNWGKRVTGQLVLFDWAEASWSHPAYDLAVLCGGFPDEGTVKVVVERYLERTTIPASGHVDQWVSWVLTAKLVSFVWFAAWWRRGRLTKAATAGINALQKGLVPWIRAIRPAMSSMGL
ncbi:MAG: aminoglycoside phosphotransferase family protein [Sulfobacillus thermotolerans]|nr:aminoglycoside phosphotransferase family protein [Sulfobacillus thermotolerans]